MNAICVSRCMQQLLHPLIAHLSLLANPVCVIPAGSSPPPDSSVLLQLDKILLWCVQPQEVSQRRNWKLNSSRCAVTSHRAALTCEVF